jgi:hypothetical protein
MGLLRIGSKAFGLLSVSGRSRVAKPPTRITACMELPYFKIFNWVGVFNDLEY